MQLALSTDGSIGQPFDISTDGLIGLFLSTVLNHGSIKTQKL